MYNPQLNIHRASLTILDMHVPQRREDGAAQHGTTLSSVCSHAENTCPFYSLVGATLFTVLGFRSVIHCLRQPRA